MLTPDLTRAPTMVTIVLLRQLPIAAVVQNLLLGLSTAQHRAFLVGTILGYLPNTLAVTLIGSGLGKSSLAAALTQISLAIGLLGTVALLVAHVRRQRRAGGASGQDTGSRSAP